MESNSSEQNISQRDNLLNFNPIKEIIIDEDSKIIFEETKTLKEAVYQRVLNWFIEQKHFMGESIMQSDEPIIDAPNLLSELADDFFKFKYKHNEKDI